MEIKYIVTDDREREHGSFRKLGDALEHAQKVADDLNIEVYVEEITIKFTECIMPN